MVGVVLAACLVPPLVGDAPNVCPGSRQLIECGCSEYLAWSESPTATSWHIIRSVVHADGTTGPEVEVGSLLAVTCYWTDTDPDPWNETWVQRKRVTPRVWMFAEDDPMPVVGQRYRYRIKTCNDVGCLTGYGSGKAVDYVGALYAVFN